MWGSIGARAANDRLESLPAPQPGRRKKLGRDTADAALTNRSASASIVVGHGKALGRLESEVRRSIPLERTKGAHRLAPPPALQSGKVPRHRDDRHRDDALVATERASLAARSQVRPRYGALETGALDALETGALYPAPRAEALGSTAGFLEDEPEEGVPTPRPRLALDAVPRVAMSTAELRSLPLDHRAGFLLAHVDGATDVRTLIDVCAMPNDELLSIVERLLALQVLEV